MSDDFAPQAARHFRARPVLSTGLAVAVVVLGLVLATRQIGFGGDPRLSLGLGYGNDGRFYGLMTEHCGSSQLEIAAPFGYRFLLLMLVHDSGLDTFLGFQLIAVLSFAGSLVLVARIAVQIAFTEVFLPWSASFSFYRARYSEAGSGYVWIALSVWTLLAVVGLLLRDRPAKAGVSA